MLAYIPDINSWENTTAKHKQCFFSSLPFPSTKEVADSKDNDELKYTYLGVRPFSLDFHLLSTEGTSLFKSAQPRALDFT